MPEPILISIAAAIGAKSVTSIYDLVKRKFVGRRDAAAALEAAEGAAPDSPAVSALATHLASAEEEDHAFGEELRHLRRRASADQGGVVNEVNGSVSGNVVQARDIKGDISF